MLATTFSIRRWALPLISGVILFSTTIAPGRCQIPAARVDSGRLVRVAPASGPSLIGRLLRPVGPGSAELVLCRYPARPCTDISDTALVRRVPVATFSKLEVQSGNHASLGAGLGVALGAFCGAAASNGKVFLAAIPVGAAVGWLLGASSPRWQTVR
jgi:hypothetical protein